MDILGTAAALPPGWIAEWSVEHTRYYYVNTHTKQSFWTVPASLVQEQPPQTFQPPKRRPLPVQSSHIQTHDQIPEAQNVNSQNHPNQDSQHSLYLQDRPNAQQHQQISQYTRDSNKNVPQDFIAQSIPQTQVAIPALYAHQISNSHPSTYLEHGGYRSPSVPSGQGSQPTHQNFIQSTGSQMNDPKHAIYDVQSGQISQPAYISSSVVPITQNFRPQYSRQSHNFEQLQAQQQRQKNNHNHNSACVQTSETQARQLSVPGGLMGGNMMNKMSSKFAQFQRSASASRINMLPNTSTSPATGSSRMPTSSDTDWKKWGKRAAIGVAAVGALALGVDAIDGSLFDGAAGLGDGAGGGFGGTGFEGSGVGDAQTALDASTAQLAMEQQGQENAMMLLDPVGTEYTVVNSNSLI